MECLIGIRCRDFVMLAADMTNAHSIMVMKTDENKLFKLSNKLALAVSGEQGDCVQFAEYIAKNIQLYKMRNTYELSPKEAADFTRRTMAETLRSRSPYHVNLLMGGYDDEKGTQLFYMDYLASCSSLDYAAHGYGGYFSIAILDRNYKENMTKEEAYDLMKKCVQEVHKRLIINLPNFKVQIINQNGIQDLPNITPNNHSLKRKTKTYFHATCFAYFVGLMATIFVMHIFKHAQPALLYLVPACLGTPILLAIVKGDLKTLFKYEDTPENEKSEQDDKQVKSEVKKVK